MANKKKSQVKHKPKVYAESANQLKKLPKGERQPGTAGFVQNENLQCKLLKKILDPCYHCKARHPDHFGQDCPQRKLDKCWHCKQDKPNHAGEDCPVKTRKKQKAKALPPPQLSEHNSRERRHMRRLVARLTAAGLDEASKAIEDRKRISWANDRERYGKRGATVAAEGAAQTKTKVNKDGWTEKQRKRWEKTEERNPRRKLPKQAHAVGGDAKANRV